MKKCFRAINFPAQSHGRKMFHNIPYSKISQNVLPAARGLHGLSSKMF